MSTHNIISSESCVTCLTGVTTDRLSLKFNGGSSESEGRKVHIQYWWVTFHQPTRPRPVSRSLPLCWGTMTTAWQLGSFLPDPCRQRRTGLSVFSRWLVRFGNEGIRRRGTFENSGAAVFRLGNVVVFVAFIQGRGKCCVRPIVRVTQIGLWGQSSEVRRQHPADNHCWQSEPICSGLDF